MDATPSMVNLKENRHPKKMVKKSSLHKTDHHHHPKLSDVLATPDMLPSASSSSYPLQQALGPGGNAIAQAASQAIAATQALTGRRTSSLKASFEAIHMGVQSHEFSVGRELAGAAASAIAGTSFGPDGPPPKRKKSRSTEQVLDVVTAGGSGGGFLDDSSFMDDPDLNLSADLRDQDWNFDPNEPRYCICNQVSYGDMVACDNEDVSFLTSFLLPIYISGLYLFSYSVLMSGFIIHALALKLPPRANGIAPLVKEILLGEKAVNKMMIDCNH